jgi:hypothetical protein
MFMFANFSFLQPIITSPEHFVWNFIKHRQKFLYVPGGYLPGIIKEVKQNASGISLF